MLAGLWVVCASDLPDVIRYVKPSELDTLGLSVDEAIAVGKENVMAALRPLKSVVRKIPAGAIGTIAGDPYEASRLLFPESWKFLARRMHGNLIVAAPGNDMVLCAEARDPQTIADMARLAAGKVNRPLSTAVFRWTPAGWEVARP